MEVKLWRTGQTVFLNRLIYESDRNKKQQKENSFTNIWVVGIYNN